MEWFRSPLAIVAFGVYALLLFGLLGAYLRPSRRSNPAVDGPDGTRVPGSGAEAAANTGTPDPQMDIVAPDRSSNASVFRDEAEKLFARDRDPVIVADEALRTVFLNRAARKLFGISEDGIFSSLAQILGSNEAEIRKVTADVEKPESVSVACRLPNGGDGTAQLRVAVMNRLPRILAIRVTALEAANPGWLARTGRKAAGQTSLTRGGRLDFREIDPATVELSADQMLGPLREIDERLRKVSDGSPVVAADPSLQAARGRLRKLIRHIEEIDWMLQVTDGHLHLRPEEFKAYELLSGMASAANRMAGENGPRLRLSPSEQPAVEPLLAGDRRIFEKILTQLLTSAFRSADEQGIAVDYRSEPFESPSQSDDWTLFADEETGRSQATQVTVRIAFRRPVSENAADSDLPAVIETLGSAIIDPKLSRRLDFVRKGRDSDLFGLTLARELVSKLEGELAFQGRGEGESEFVLSLRFDNAA